MKLHNLIPIIGLISVGNATAASGLYESYGIIKINTTTSYYDMQATTANPDLEGAALGTFDTTVGNTLTLSGGQVKTWKDPGSNVTGSYFDYRVYKNGDTPGSFIEFSLPYDKELGGNNNQQWMKDNQNVNLLSGLSDGNYTLEVFARATALSPDLTHYSNRGGANYKASFTVVPEPTGAALGLLGMGLLLRRRRI